MNKKSQVVFPIYELHLPTPLHGIQNSTPSKTNRYPKKILNSGYRGVYVIYKPKGPGCSARVKQGCY